MKKSDFVPDGHFSGPVSSDWISRAVPLSDAWRTFGAPHHVKQAEEAAGNFAEVRDGETIDVFLFNHQIDWRGSVRQVHGTLRGKALDAFVQYFIARQAAEMDVEGQLGFGKLFAFGDPDRPGADPIWIPVRAWRYLYVDWTEKDCVSGQGAAYWFVRIVKAPDGDTSLEKKHPTNGGKPKFNAGGAKAQLVARKMSDWATPPTESESRNFLLQIYNGVPNEQHRRIRREVWPDMIRRGRPKTKRRISAEK